MKNFEQIAQAMCEAYAKKALELAEEGEHVSAACWELQSHEAKLCWIAAAKQAAAELALAP